VDEESLLFGEDMIDDQIKGWPVEGGEVFRFPPEIKGSSGESFVQKKGPDRGIRRSTRHPKGVFSGRGEVVRSSDGAERAFPAAHLLERGQPFWKLAMMGELKEDGASPDIEKEFLLHVLSRCQTVKGGVTSPAVAVCSRAIFWSTGFSYFFFGLFFLFFISSSDSLYYNLTRRKWFMTSIIFLI